jgi:hypothetical protein
MVVLLTMCRTLNMLHPIVMEIKYVLICFVRKQKFNVQNMVKDYGFMGQLLK